MVWLGANLAYPRLIEACKSAAHQLIQRRSSSPAQKLARFGIFPVEHPFLQSADNQKEADVGANKTKRTRSAQSGSGVYEKTLHFYLAALTLGELMATACDNARDAGGLTIARVV